MRAAIWGLLGPHFFIYNKYNEGRFMDIIDSKDDKEILLSMIAEVAKSSAEIRDAQNDIAKAQNRIKFVLVLINKMIERNKG